MKRYMFFITLAQWSIAKILEAPIPERAGSADDAENVPALMKAFSELNVARGCGETDFVPASSDCATQLTPAQLERLCKGI